MTTPKTLLEMSGADLKPPPLSGSTLVIIDAQNEYLDGKLALPDVKAAVEALARLLAKARSASAPVVHKGRAGGLFDLTHAAAPSSMLSSRSAPRASCTSRFPTPSRRPISMPPSRSSAAPSSSSPAS
jgi:hypothetical protein